MRIFKKFKITRKRIIIILVLVFLAGYLFFRSKGDIQPVSTTVQKGTVKQELVLSGSVKATNHVSLLFPTSGKVSWVGVVEGQKVTKGQALVSLDKVVLNAIYQQALNNYKNYQAAADSTLDSLKGHAADETYAQKATRTAAEVARDNAYDNLKAAKYNLDNATLYAPFSGFVTYVGVTSGVNFGLSQVAVEVLDPSSLYFEVEADQNDIVSVKQEMQVLVLLDSLQNSPTKAKTTYVSLTPKSGQAETAYKIKLDFLELNSFKNLAKVGMTGDAKFILSQKENVLNVPSRYVNTDRNGRFVNLGKPDNKVYVEIGIEGEDLTEITKGVAEGDILYD